MISVISTNSRLLIDIIRLMFITVNGKRLHYEEKGSGEPILFVHGWPASIKSLYRLYQIASQNYRAIIIDLPGFGKSDNPDPDWGVAEYAKFLVEFIDRLNLKPVIFFGHSFGGALGIYIASNYPNYIKRLILCGASYKRTSPSTTKISRFLS